MSGKESPRNTNVTTSAPVDYSNFYKTTGLMAGFTFFMSAGRFGRTANIVARAGFLYGLHQVGKIKQAEQKVETPTATVVPDTVGKALGALTSLFFQPEKPPAALAPERIVSTLAKTADTILIGGGEVVNKFYKP